MSLSCIVFDILLFRDVTWPRRHPFRG